MNDIRRNAINGMIEFTQLAIDGTRYMTFNEWWNGEGLDFSFDEEPVISLHLDDMHAMFVAAIASGYVDVDEVIKEADALNRQSEKRARDIENIRFNYRQQTNPTNGDW